MVEFKVVPLPSLRKQYLACLHYPQELHCEWLVAAGPIVLKQTVRKDKMLHRKEEIFGKLLQEFGIKRI